MLPPWILKRDVPGALVQSHSPYIRELRETLKKNNIYISFFHLTIIRELQKLTKFNIEHQKSGICMPKGPKKASVKCQSPL